MNVVSVSRRTDIPAHYAEWFAGRLRAGSASYLNPFNGALHTVSLEPDDVIAFVFWTRNAAHFLSPARDLERRGFAFYFQYTVTGYGAPLEAHPPPEGEALDAFERLSGLLGPSRVRWRYDPILLSERMDRSFHLARFEGILQRLEGRTEVCHTSFVQFYRKTARRLSRLDERTGDSFRDPPGEEKIALARELCEMAASREVRLVSCCQPLLDEAGLPRGRCVDPDLIRKLRPDLEDLALEERPSRPGCGCVASRDIGAYDTCPGGCAYCYATGNPKKALAYHEAHDPSKDRL